VSGHRLNLVIRIYRPCTSPTDGLKLRGMATGDLAMPGPLPSVIGVHGARHGNLRDADVGVPLGDPAVAMSAIAPSGPGTWSA
jgi:hypothetical protein